jgi:thioredoxin-dependent peroxiredoxin
MRFEPHAVGAFAVDAGFGPAGGSVLQAASTRAAASSRALRSQCERNPAAAPTGCFWQDDFRSLPLPESCMTKTIAWIMMLGALCLPARAALDVGDAAPNFTVPAALGGKTFQYNLAEQLAKGPVVLYFFPAAFSEGCSIEAHQFAEAIGKFEALGASVIGVSGDDLELITRFSVQACQGKFPVAADEKKAVIKAFDAAMQTRPEFANRISYVIAPNGRVIYSYLSLNPTRHVERTLGALQQWAKDNPKR